MFNSARLVVLFELMTAGCKELSAPQCPLSFPYKSDCRTYLDVHEEKELRLEHDSKPGRLYVRKELKHRAELPPIMLLRREWKELSLRQDLNP